MNAYVVANLNIELIKQSRLQVCAHKYSTLVRVFCYISTWHVKAMNGQLLVEMYIYMYPYMYP